MKGLLRNNCYAALSELKAFFVIVVVFGGLMVILDNKNTLFLASYILLCMTGVSANTIVGTRKGSNSKWDKYKLTAPVHRSEIVASCYLNFLVWLLAGIVLAGIGCFLSVFVHGYPFERNTQIFLLFVVGIGISLFLAAILFPLFQYEREKRDAVFWTLGALCSIGFVMGLAMLFSALFGPHITAFQVILSGFMILACAFVTFVLSFFLTLHIFKRQEIF